jgi:uncharacterized protein YndB with AHSA1/START domain
MSHEIKMTVSLNCPAAQAWEAFSSAEALERWLCEKADVGMSRGGNYRLRSRVPSVSGSHRVAMFESEHCLMLDWELEGAISAVKIRFEDDALDRSLMLITHRLPQDLKTIEKLSQAWEKVGALLKSYLETDREGVQWNPAWAEPVSSWTWSNQ